MNVTLLCCVFFPTECHKQITTSSVATSYFLESTVLFFHNFKILYFFQALYFFFINLAGFYQILFKSSVFVLFLEILQIAGNRG